MACHTITMLLSMPSIRVVTTLLLCVLVMKGGLAAKNAACADSKYKETLKKNIDYFNEILSFYEEFTRRYTEKVNNIDKMLKTLQDDMKEKSPNQAEKIDAYVQCQSRRYEDYYRPDAYLAIKAEMLAVKDVFDKFIPEFDKDLLHYRKFYEEYADNVKKNRNGPGYDGCNAYRLSGDIPDTTSLKLIIPQKYAAASTLQIKSELKSMYEKIASGLKVEYEKC
ncbi:unnamed protein product [Trichobilharzia szidati]|nr:unnamed protein product [Trichobilharzia szidati]